MTTNPVGAARFDSAPGLPCCWRRHAKLPPTNGDSRGPAVRQAVEGTVLPVRFRDRTWVAAYRRDTMPIEDGKIIYEFRCYDCGYEIEDEERGPRIPLRDCPECDDGKLHHVGPPIDECDKCGQKLLYHGNSGLGSDTLCETCYGRLEVMM